MLNMVTFNSGLSIWIFTANSVYLLEWLHAWSGCHFLRVLNNATSVLAWCSSVTDYGFGPHNSSTGHQSTRDKPAKTGHSTKWGNLNESHCNTTDTPTANALHTGFFTDANRTESRTGQCILHCSAKNPHNPLQAVTNIKDRRLGLLPLILLWALNKCRMGRAELIIHVCQIAELEQNSCPYTPVKNTTANYAICMTKKEKALYLIPVTVS